MVSCLIEKRRKGRDADIKLILLLRACEYDAVPLAQPPKKCLTMLDRGINRMTSNVELALPIIDDSFRISDAEAVSMSRYLVHKDGLFLGSSSACNLVACIKLVRKMGWKEGQRVVTILWGRIFHSTSSYELICLPLGVAQV
jgi:threonine synthase